jgi:diguanylate cyclase (GGDEF)-like protein/PAS domain S-box-containing protein
MSSIRDLAIDEIMSSQIHTLSPQRTFLEALRMLAKLQVSCLLVTRDGQALGILTEHDAVRLLTLDVRLDIPVSQIMSTPVVTAPATLDFRSTYYLLLGHQIGHLIVTDKNGSLCGIVSETDLRSHLGQELFQKTQDIRTATETAFVILRQDATLQDAIRHMGEANCDFVLVLSDEEVCGIITEHDIPRLLADDIDNRHLPLKQVMSSPLVTISIQNSLAEAAARMQRKQIRHMVVMDSQRQIVGILSLHRLLERLGGVIIDHSWEERRSAELAHIHTRLLLEMEHEFARLLQDEPNRESILQAMLDAALRLPEIDGGALFKQQQGGNFILVRHRGLSSSLVEHIAELPADASEVRAIRQGVFLSCCDTETPLCNESRLVASPPVKEAGIQAVALLPLRIGNDVKACLYLVSQRVDALAPDTMTALDTLSRQFTQALEKLAAVNLANSRLDALRRSEETLRTLIDAMPDVICLKDGEGRWLLANAFNLHLFQLEGVDYQGKRDSELGYFSPFYRDALLNCEATDERTWRSGKAIRSDEIVPCPDGSNLIFDVIKVPTFRADGTRKGLIVVGRDITDRKRAEEQLQKLAHFDSLTHLPNRALLSDRLRVASAQTKRKGTLLAVCYLDLDGFKPVNDRHGHDIGDRLLVEVADRLSESLRAGDSVGRLGGDEFVLLLNDLNNDGECHFTLERILKRLSAPYHVNGFEFVLSASIGVTIYPNDATDSDTLLRHADQAMYEAKQAGRNRYHFFDVGRDQRLRVLRESQLHIQQALQNGEMTLHYQPKVNMRHGQVYGVEALIRWRHPQRGWVHPLEFLPQISETDIAMEIDLWVLKQALQQIRTWREAGLALTISVNIGAHTLGHGDFQSNLEALLRQYPELPHNTLELEILESVALDDIHHVSSIMEQCRKLGIGFALDDFGTGYSSLLYLRHLPASMLKVDQSFIRDMLEDSDDLNIVEGIIGLADAFQCDVIAEGVESIEHGDLLLQLGCSLAQGFGIAAPMAATELPAWIDRYNQPDCWRKYREFSGPHPDVQLLLMSLEYRRWVEKILHMIEHDPTRENTKANLSPASVECRFGRWYQGPGKHRFGNRPLFREMGDVHERVHQLSHRLIELWQTGLLKNSDGLKQELMVERDNLLSNLEDLREYH